jgi:hypothetical protein
MEPAQQTKVKKTRAPKATAVATAVATAAEPKVKEVKAKKVKAAPPKKAPAPPKVDDSINYVATSRIKTYINDNKLNKDVNQILSIIKNAREFKTDLNQLLSAEQQDMVGKYRINAIESEKKRDERIAKSGKTPAKPVEYVSALDPYTVAEKAFTRNKVKFSKDSFQVVGVVLDKILYELIVRTMDNMIEHAKLNSISVKYIAVDKDSALFPVYSNTKAYQSLSTSTPTLVEEGDAETTTEVDDSEDKSTDSKINFECYIRKILNKAKTTDDKYVAFKNSTPFKRWCSDLVLDVLDRICRILDTVSTNLHIKTINKDLFVTIFKIMICDSNDHVCDQQLFKDVDSVLDELEQYKNDQNAKRKTEKEAKSG